MKHITGRGAQLSAPQVGASQQWVYSSWWRSVLSLFKVKRSRDLRRPSTSGALLQTCCLDGKTSPVQFSVANSFEIVPCARWDHSASGLSSRQWVRLNQEKVLLFRPILHRCRREISRHIVSSIFSLPVRQTVLYKSPSIRSEYRHRYYFDTASSNSHLEGWSILRLQDLSTAWQCL